MTCCDCMARECGASLSGGFSARVWLQGVDHGKYVMNLAVALGSFIKAGRLGSLIGSDSGVWLGRDPDTVREPDIAFISSERVSLGVSVPGYFGGRPRPRGRDRLSERQPEECKRQGQDVA